MATPQTDAALTDAARKYGVLAMPDLEYTPELAEEMGPAYEPVSKVIPPIEWPAFAPYVKAINRLKKERNAVILAHNYLTPDIFHCVSDIVGDSLQLAKEAAGTTLAKNIVTLGLLSELFKAKL